MELVKGAINNSLYLYVSTATPLFILWIKKGMALIFFPKNIIQITKEKKWNKKYNISRRLVP